MRTVATAFVFLVVAAAPAAAQQPCAGGYVVRSGDSLADIAAYCGITIPALLSANPAVRDEADLAVGGRLRIPPPGTDPTPVQACGGFYTLRPGDGLPEVAAKCGLTVPLLVAANPALENPDNVRPGGRIRIPDLPAAGAGIRPVILPAGGSAAVIGAAGGATGAAATGAAGTGADAAAADTSAPAPPEPWLRYEGVLRQGARCIVLRMRDGTEVGIAGGLGRPFGVGDRVAVTGPAADGEACGTARTVQVRIMWVPRTE